MTTLGQAVRLGVALVLTGIASGCGAAEPNEPDARSTPLASTTTAAGEKPTDAVEAVVSLASGKDHSCAATASGHAFCAGENTSGELGTGTKDERGQGPDGFVEVRGIDNAVQVSAGHGESCALLKDATIKCWGNVGEAVGGQGAMPDDVAPDIAVTVRGVTEATAVSMSANGSGNCAVLTDGRVKCWNTPLTEGGAGEGLDPEPSIVSGLADVKQVTSGLQYSCALLETGSVRCWGFNRNGELGTGDITDRERPATVKGLTDAVSINASGTLDHTCAVRRSGAISCWGSGLGKQLGNDMSSSGTCAEPEPGTVTRCGTAPFTTPVEVIGVADAIQADDTCALRKTGKIGSSLLRVGDRDV